MRIAAHTIRFPANHILEDIEKLIRLQLIRHEDSIVKSAERLGATAPVIGGVAAGKGCVLAGGYVKIKDLTDYAIVTGIPARVSGWR